LTTTNDFSDKILNYQRYFVKNYKMNIIQTIDFITFLFYRRTGGLIYTVVMHTFKWKNYTDDCVQPNLTGVEQMVEQVMAEKKIT